VVGDRFAEVIDLDAHPNSVAVLSLRVQFLIKNIIFN